MGVFNIEFDFGCQRRRWVAELTARADRAEVDWEAGQAGMDQAIGARWAMKSEVGHTHELGQPEKLVALGCSAWGCFWESATANKAWGGPWGEEEGGMMSTGRGPYAKMHPNTHDWSMGDWSNCPEELKGPWVVQLTRPRSFQILNQLSHFLTLPTAKHKKTPANPSL